ncbi:glycoside hydrolase family protein, partial [Candidatus Liberibacter solanacearum]
MDFVKGFEGLCLTAYRCLAGIWTIGYGHTGNDVFKDLVITEQ